jgi:hypothetical protein
VDFKGMVTMANQVMIVCEGDSAYWRRIKMLANKRGVSAKRLVREALDAQYGKDIASFFVDDGSQKKQTELKSAGKGR